MNCLAPNACDHLLTTANWAGEVHGLKVTKADGVSPLRKNVRPSSHVPPRSKPFSAPLLSTQSALDGGPLRCVHMQLADYRCRSTSSECQLAPRECQLAPSLTRRSLSYGWSCRSCRRLTGRLMEPHAAGNPIGNSTKPGQQAWLRLQQLQSQTSSLRCVCTLAQHARGQAWGCCMTQLQVKSPSSLHVLCQATLLFLAGGVCRLSGAVISVRWLWCRDRDTAYSRKVAVSIPRLAELHRHWAWTYRSVHALCSRGAHLQAALAVAEHFSAVVCRRMCRRRTSTSTTWQPLPHQPM